MVLLFINNNVYICFQRQDDSEYEYEYESEYEAQDETEAALGLPSDSKTIRENIVDEFTCDARPYGYVDCLHFGQLFVLFFLSPSWSSFSTLAFFRAIFTIF